MRVREVICKRWFLDKHIQAITIAPFIFFNGVPSEETRTHELVHIAQVNRLGWLKFYILYLYYSWKYGYRQNPFEKEAYKD